MQKIMTFLHIPRKIKISDLEIMTNWFGIKFCTIKFLQILILTKNGFLIWFQSTKKIFICASSLFQKKMFCSRFVVFFLEISPWAYFRVKTVWIAIISRAVVAKNRQVKKWPSPILKFHSNFESPIWSVYAGKFSDRLDDTSYFYRTRKVDDGFFG